MVAMAAPTVTRLQWPWQQKPLPVVQGCRHTTLVSAAGRGVLVKASSSLEATISIRQAAASAELRAAAYLRASVFNVLPGKSVTVQQTHIKTKADAAWQELEEGVAKGRSDPGSGALLVPLIAVVKCEVTPPDAHPACMLPAQGPGSLPELVVGTLDVNRGPRLACEELGPSMRHMASADARAFLSNVCVHTAWRQRGIARSLLEAAGQVAADLGARHVFVHVAADNEAAAALYQRCGYSKDCEESAATARALNRPRRILLHREL